MRSDGGPAFPTPYYETEHGDRVLCTSCVPGMSLRAWLAGQALVGICAALTREPTAMEEHRGPRAVNRFEFALAAKDAVSIADAVLDALKKED